MGLRGAWRLRWVGHYVHGFYAAAGVLLSASLALALLGLWGLSILTEDVLEGDTARFDRAVLVWLHDRATPWLDRAAVEITALGDTLVLVMVALVAATFLWLLGRKAHAALLVVAVMGAGVITPVLKAVFDRPRPQVLEWRAHYAESSAAYPSGHATMSMVTLVTVAFIIHRLSKRWWTGAVAGVLAGLLTLSIGASRLYLGLHFPSDVLAGYVVGFTWAVLCALTIAAVDRSPSPREPKELHQ
jgi:undecaprenyl-diphosphatase